MICLQRRKGWEVILQRAHAMMACELLSHWREDQRPSFWPGLLSATAQHDNGWTEWEPEGRLSPTGAPMDFRQVDLHHILAQAKRVVTLGWHQDALVGWFISRHMHELYAGRTSELDALARWIEEEAEVRAERLALLPWNGDELEQAYKLMLWTDTLSLMLCEESMPFGERSVEVGMDADGQRYQARRVDDVVHVWPWPFIKEEVTVSVESYLLEQLTFADHDEFLSTLATTKPERQFFTLMPSEHPHRLGPPLDELTVAQLREVASELRIENRSSMNKSSLITAIRKRDGNSGES